MDAIFERGEVANQSVESADSTALLPLDQDLYEGALDFTKPRETAFEKAAAKIKHRGRFGRRGALERNPRIGGGFVKARSDYLDYEEGSSELLRNRFEVTADFNSANYLAEDEAPLPLARGRRQPPMRCKSFTAGSSGAGPSFGEAVKTANNSRMPIQRSLSLAAPERSQSSNSSLSSTNFPQSKTTNFSWSNAENSHPNTDLDPLDSFRERKKHRARRHSVAGPPAIVPMSQPDSTPIPVDLHWLTSGKSDEELSRASADVLAMSTTPNTTSSRRKRGPNGTPVSDAGDDWIMHSGASSDFSESRRSCIFSPEEAFQRPAIDPMDQSTDEESMPSPDTSFEVEKSKKTPMPTQMTQDFTEVRPDNDDVEYLISELRKEAKSASNGRFGKNTWSVAPPVNAWNQHRRQVFLLWAKEQLGFTVQTAGNGILFLKILKERGLKMIDSLEELLLNAPGKATEPSPTDPIFSSVSLLTSPTPFAHGVKSMDFESECNHGFDDDDLATRVAALTMNEASARKTTIATSTETHHQAQSRFSLESLVAKKSRCSVESQSRDINFHDMMGVSPRGPRTRPPRLSFGDSLGNASVKDCLPTIDATVSAHSNCIATPMNTEFRGWGSRPIGGRDWGASAPYSEELIEIYKLRFEEVCRKENLRFSFDSMHDAMCHMDDNNTTLNQKHAERIERRRRNDFHKRKRMSLLANAVGAKPSLPLTHRPTMMSIIPSSPPSIEKLSSSIAENEKIMANVLSFCSEAELIDPISLVNSQWFEWASVTHADLLVRSVTEVSESSANPLLERSWASIHTMLPWACFIAEGGAKKVYKSFNVETQRVEAVSVMDTHEIDNTDIVANELAVSYLLSSLVRRGTCPNFVRLHGVFTCAHPPSESYWGCRENKYPCGEHFSSSIQPSHPPSPGYGCPGRYQYIRMELINEGDAEEYIKRQPEALLPFQLARSVLFQLAFAVYAAADKFSVKHYDIKMLNLFIHSIPDLETDMVLRYGIGSHVYALRMPSTQAIIAKLADFGTADMAAASTGQPVALSHFTTLENTPPDFLILGDEAKQGHEHDCFGMGLCMLHLFTGGYPYEEIMEKVVCPKHLKLRLKDIWENESVPEYSVIRSIIYDGVDVDEDGDVVGEVDDTFYDTLYRFLVLFGVPSEPFKQKTRPRVWKAMYECLLAGQKPVSRKKGTRGNDVAQYKRDCKRFSIQSGTNEYIARARGALASVDGGLELLFALCNFDPMKRATAMQVLNSKFLEDLHEDPQATPNYEGAHVESFMNFYYGDSFTV